MQLCARHRYFAADRCRIADRPCPNPAQARRCRARSHP
jgi:hypothetical protein